jgi:hypothetical protein
VVRSEYNGTAQCPSDTGHPHVTCFVNYCICDFRPMAVDASLRNVTVLPDTDPTFLDTNFGNSWLPPPQYASYALTDQYWYALFFAIMVTTSIGNLDRPVGVTENAFTAVVILLGLMMYSIVIGSASSALANINSAGANRQKMLDSVIAYMRGRKVPAFFQKIIVDYYNFSWETGNGDDSVMDVLPPALRSKLNMIINRDIVDRIPVFGYMSAEVYLKTVPHLAAATFLPGDHIARRGDNGDHMFFLKSGKVDCVLPNGTDVFLTLLPGDFFGEKSLLYMCKRDASFRAVDFVDVLVMERATFTELYISAADFIREVQKADAARDKSRLAFETALSEKAKDEAEDEVGEADEDGTVHGYRVDSGGASLFEEGLAPRSWWRRLVAAVACQPDDRGRRPCFARRKALRLCCRRQLRTRGALRLLCRDGRSCSCARRAEDTHHLKWHREQRMKQQRQVQRQGSDLSAEDVSEFVGGSTHDLSAADLAPAPVARAAHGSRRGLRAPSDRDAAGPTAGRTGPQPLRKQSSAGGAAGSATSLKSIVRNGSRRQMTAAVAGSLQKRLPSTRSALNIANPAGSPAADTGTPSAAEGADTQVPHGDRSKQMRPRPMLRIEQEAEGAPAAAGERATTTTKAALAVALRLAGSIGNIPAATAGLLPLTTHSSAVSTALDAVGVPSDGSAGSPNPAEIGLASGKDGRASMLLQAPEPDPSAAAGGQDEASGPAAYCAAAAGRAWSASRILACATGGALESEPAARRSDVQLHPAPAPSGAVAVAVLPTPRGDAPLVLLHPPASSTARSLPPSQLHLGLRIPQVADGSVRAGGSASGDGAVLHSGRLGSRRAAAATRAAENRSLLTDDDDDSYSSEAVSNQNETDDDSDVAAEPEPKLPSSNTGTSARAGASSASPLPSVRAHGLQQQPPSSAMAFGSAADALTSVTTVHESSDGALAPTAHSRGEGTRSASSSLRILPPRQTAHAKLPPAGDSVRASLTPGFGAGMLQVAQSTRGLRAPIGVVVGLTGPGHAEAALPGQAESLGSARLPGAEASATASCIPTPFGPVWTGGAVIEPPPRSGAFVGSFHSAAAGAGVSSVDGAGRQRQTDARDNDDSGDAARGSMMTTFFAMQRSRPVARVALSSARSGSVSEARSAAAALAIGGDILDGIGTGTVARTPDGAASPGTSQRAGATMTTRRSSVGAAGGSAARETRRGTGSFSPGGPRPAAAAGAERAAAVYIGSPQTAAGRSGGSTFFAAPSPAARSVGAAGETRSRSSSITAAAAIAVLATVSPLAGSARPPGAARRSEGPAKQDGSAAAKRGY